MICHTSYTTFCIIVLLQPVSYTHLDVYKRQASTLAKKIAPNSKLSIKKKKTTILAPRTIASSATAATKTSLSNKTARSKLASNVRASVINEKHVDSWDDDGDAESWDTNW